MGEFSRGYGHATTKLPALLLATIGVVFGDIGTSPLYALKETFAGHHPIHVTQASVLGVLSLIFWTIIMLVSIKYVIVIMRADNQGEGGSLALLALRQRADGGRPRRLVHHLAGHLRRGAVLRRQHDHAGDLGAVRGRRPEGDRAAARGLCRPDHDGRAGRALPDPEARHRRRRPLLRPRHGASGS